MDAAQALADLTEISSQVVHAAIFEEEGGVLAATIGDDARAARFVDGVRTLLGEAERLRQLRGLPGLAQLEAATLDGSVFVVRRDGRAVAATTLPDPTVGLVFYDLKHCLRAIAEPAPEPAPEAPVPAAAPRRARRAKPAPAPAEKAEKDAT